MQVSRHFFCVSTAAAGLWTGPQLQWHINCLELLVVWLALRRFKTLATQEISTSPYGQHCDRWVHQPSRGSTLPLHVTTRPPSPPLESEASEVALRRSCCRRAQSYSRRALTSARSSGRMTTPPRCSPDNWETLRGPSGRPACLPRHVPLPAQMRWHTAGLGAYANMCFCPTVLSVFISRLLRLHQTANSLTSCL